MESTYVSIPLGRLRDVVSELEGERVEKASGPSKKREGGKEVATNLGPILELGRSKEPEEAVEAEKEIEDYQLTSLTKEREK